MIIFRSIATCLILGALCQPAATQVLYKVLDLGFLPGETWSFAESINNRGDVAGAAGFPKKAWVYTDKGGMVALGTLPGARYTTATGINDLGQVVGSADRALYLFTPGKGMKNLGRMGPYDPVSSASRIAINNLTEVVGAGLGTLFNAGLEPFHYSPTTGLKSVTPGVKGILYDINNKGEASGNINSVTGVWSQARGFRARRLPSGVTGSSRILITDDSEVIGIGIMGGGFYLVSDSPTRGPRVLTQLTKHPSGGSTGYFVTGVNSQGMVVGNWTWQLRSAHKSGSFVYSPSIGCLDIQTLIDPNWRIGIVGDVNELGQITATGVTGSLPHRHPLRLDPVSPAASVVPVGQGCGARTIPPMLAGSKPQVNRDMAITLASRTPRAGGALFLGLPASPPIPLGAGCTLYLNPLAPMVPLQNILTDSSGDWTGTLPVPASRSLLGAKFALQALLVPTRTPLGFDLSNALIATVGF